MMDVLRAMFGRERPYDEQYWHRWQPFVPVRDVCGRWIFFEALRRRGLSGWEYRQYDESFDEWLDRQ